MTDKPYTEDNATPSEKSERVTRTGEQARGGIIILRHRWARILFVSALFGIAIVAVA